MIIPSNQEVKDLSKKISGADKYAIGMAMAESFDYKYYRMDSVLEGFFGGICLKHRPWEWIIALCEALKSDRYNYNDLDCDMWAFTAQSGRECLCDKLKEVMGIDNSNCDCVDGYEEDCYKHYFLVHSNHGNGMLYHVVVDKSGYSQAINIRRLPYNWCKYDLEKLGERLADSAKENNVEDDFLRYQDSRDAGFSFSFRNSKSSIVDCKISDFSGYDIDYIKTCLLPEIENINK